MRLIFVLCSCLVILVATLSVANFSSAEEQSGQSAKIHLIPIEFGNFTNDGRPPNFYRLFNSENQRLCASLLLALNEPHPPARLADLDGILTNVLLGSKFTIHWTKLGRYSYRTVVDLNVSVQ